MGSLVEAGGPLTTEGIADSVPKGVPDVHRSRIRCNLDERGGLGVGKRARFDFGAAIEHRASSPQAGSRPLALSCSSRSRRSSDISRRVIAWNRRQEDEEPVAGAQDDVSAKGRGPPSLRHRGGNRSGGKAQGVKVRLIAHAVLGQAHLDEFISFERHRRRGEAGPPSRSAEEGLSHFDDHGRASNSEHRVEALSHRLARASCAVRMSLVGSQLLREGTGPDLISEARTAGLEGAKRTAAWIPLCHPIRIDAIRGEITTKETEATITATAEMIERTVGEMESLTACACVALSLVRAVLSVNPGVRVDDLVLLHKSGGWPGTWNRERAASRLRSFMAFS